MLDTRTIVNVSNSLFLRSKLQRVFFKLMFFWKFDYSNNRLIWKLSITCWLIISFYFHCSSSDHQYFFKSFDFIILRWCIRVESFRDDLSQFHEISIFKSQNALVVHSYKSNDLIVSDMNRLQKFSNHRECVVFSKININEIHFDSKTDEMINSIFIVVFFIHWNKIIVDSIQRVIDWFFLIDSTRHDLVCLNQSTRFAFIDRRCWLEIINFDLVYLLSEMSKNFRSRMFKHFVSFSASD
jgi:hypothetical protein